MKVNYETKYDVVSDLYDIYVAFSGDIQFWLDATVNVDEVLELTSGTGRITLPLAREGKKVTAIDASSTLLKVLNDKAEKEGLHINIIKADIRKFTLDKIFPLAIFPFNSFQELIDSKDQKSALKQINKHLYSGAKFFITSRNYQAEELADADTKKLIGKYEMPGKDTYLKFWNYRRYLRGSSTAMSYQIFEEVDKNDELIERRFFKNHHYIFSPGEIEGLLNSAGFQVINKYGDYNKSHFNTNSPYMIIEAEKIDVV